MDKFPLILESSEYNSKHYQLRRLLVKTFETRDIYIQQKEG
jgi:hypothetical protein